MPTEKIVIYPSVDVAAHYPEYQKSVNRELRKNRSLKDNWVYEHKGIPQVQRGLKNTVENGAKILASIFGALPTERFTDYTTLPGITAESVEEWGTGGTPGWINRWCAAPPSCIQLKESAGPNYMTRWLTDDNGWDGRWVTEGNEYVKFITNFADIAGRCDCKTAPGAWWDTVEVNNLYLATGQYRITVNTTRSATPETTYTNNDYRFFRPIVGAYQVDTPSAYVSYFDYGDTDTASDTGRYWYLTGVTNNRDSIKFGGSDFLGAIDCRFDMMGVNLNTFDLDTEGCKGPQVSSLALSDTISKPNSVELAVAWTYSLAEA